MHNDEWKCNDKCVGTNFLFRSWELNENISNYDFYYSNIQIIILYSVKKSKYLIKCLT